VYTPTLVQTGSIPDRTDR